MCPGDMQVSSDMHQSKSGEASPVLREGLCCHAAAQDFTFQACMPREVCNAVHAKQFMLCCRQLSASRQNLRQGTPRHACSAPRPEAVSVSSLSHDIAGSAADECFIVSYGLPDGINQICVVDALRGSSTDLVRTMSDATVAHAKWDVSRTPGTCPSQIMHLHSSDVLAF